MTPAIDVAVIGAGPAGMAAALTLRTHGLSVAVLDEQPSPGGQIYRAVATGPLRDGGILGPDYAQGRGLVEAFLSAGIDYRPGAVVWQVGPGAQIACTVDERAHRLAARAVLIATGAMERPMPVPGWTLPGVMTAGAAQILLKEAGVAKPHAVFAGTGPLLYLVATQYRRAGVPIKAVLDLTPGANVLPAVARALGALRASRYLVKGTEMMAGLAGLHVSRIEEIRAEGEGRLEAVRYRRRGRWHRLETEALFLHQGVVPQTSLALAAGCAHDWDPSQLCWRPRLDAWGGSSAAGIAIAGDGAGIGGAVAAELSGRIAGLGLAEHLGRITEAERDRHAAPLLVARRRDLQVRPFLETLFRPGDAQRIPPEDATIVCRCEEVTAGALRVSLALGAQGPNQLKAFNRCGMGPCQGRLCGLTVSEMIAAARGLPVQAVGTYRIRPPVKPVTLGALAALDGEGGD